MRYGFMISVANAVIITLPLMAGVASAEPPLVVAQASPAAIPAAPSVQGVTSTEIKFGMTAPFSGSSKEYGVQLRTGVQTAFKIVNDAGGIATVTQMHPIWVSFAVPQDELPLILEQSHARKLKVDALLRGDTDPYRAAATLLDVS